jgi:hypothetical protein
VVVDESLKKLGYQTPQEAGMTHLVGDKGTVVPKARRGIGKGHMGNVFDLQAAIAHNIVVLNDDNSVNHVIPLTVDALRILQEVNKSPPGRNRPLGSHYEYGDVAKAGSALKGIVGLTAAAGNKPVKGSPPPGWPTPELVQERLNADAAKAAAAAGQPAPEAISTVPENGAVPVAVSHGLGFDTVSPGQYVHPDGHKHPPVPPPPPPPPIQVPVPVAVPPPPLIKAAQVAPLHPLAQPPLSHLSPVTTAAPQPQVPFPPRQAETASPAGREAKTGRNLMRETGLDPDGDPLKLPQVQVRFTIPGFGTLPAVFNCVWQTGIYLSMLQYSAVGAFYEAAVTASPMRVDWDGKVLACFVGSQVVLPGGKLMMSVFLVDPELTQQIQAVP